MTMTQMLEATFAYRAELQKQQEHEIVDCAKAFEIDGVGKVWCGLQIVQSYSTLMRPHFRRIWHIDGKRIAASKLKKIVGA